MKRFFGFILVLFAAVALASCGDPFADEKIVLITDKGDITDKSFNEGAYNGVKKFADKHKVEYGYLKPEKATDDEYIIAIEQAIADGATIIVTPGFLFEGPINIVQHEYPDVKFIILDGSPEGADDGTIEANVHGVFYAEEQSGFLAGYAAVMEGYRKLGFMGGMAVPAVQRFGHGYVQGAAAAAEALELEDDAVEISYLYTGNFVASPDVQAAAATMYGAGVEVIFACGGAVGQSVFAAANDAGKKAIGVDVDQSFDSDVVITSAMKELAESVVQALEAALIDKTWDAKYGGKALTLSAKEDGVGLPMETSRFENFKQADYDALFAAVVDGSLEVSDVIGAFGDTGDAAKQFETDKVSVTVIPFG